MTTMARSSAQACLAAGRVFQTMTRAHVDFLRGRLGQDENRRHSETRS